jgi:hypothetical protein
MQVRETKFGTNMKEKAQVCLLTLLPQHQKTSGVKEKTDFRSVF